MRKTLVESLYRFRGLMTNRKIRILSYLEIVERAADVCGSDQTVRGRFEHRFFMRFLHAVRRAQTFTAGVLHTGAVILNCKLIVFIYLDIYRSLSVDVQGFYVNE